VLVEVYPNLLDYIKIGNAKRIGTTNRLTPLTNLFKSKFEFEIETNYPYISSTNIMNKSGRFEYWLIMLYWNVGEAFEGELNFSGACIARA
jgi:hypothetical protein